MVIPPPPPPRQLEFDCFDLVQAATAVLTAANTAALNVWLQHFLSCLEDIVSMALRIFPSPLPVFPEPWGRWGYCGCLIYDWAAHRHIFSTLWEAVNFLRLLLKAPHFLIIGHREIKQLPGSSYLLASFHSSGSCHIACLRIKDINDVTQLWTLWASVTTSMARCVHGCNGGTNVIGVANWSLLGFKAWRRKHIPSTLFDQDPMVRELPGPRGEPPTTIFAK